MKCGASGLAPHFRCDGFRQASACHGGKKNPSAVRSARITMARGVWLHRVGRQHAQARSTARCRSALTSENAVFIELEQDGGRPNLASGKQRTNKRDKAFRVRSGSCEGIDQDGGAVLQRYLGGWRSKLGGDVIGGREAGKEVRQLLRLHVYAGRYAGSQQDAKPGQCVNTLHVVSAVLSVGVRTGTAPRS